jgi:hypothetical protein
VSTWYAASLFFESIHEPPIGGPPLWEEVILLIAAKDEAAAQVKADEIGLSKEHRHFVAEPSRHIVRWKFVKTERLLKIDDDVLRDGTELFSRFLRTEEATSLLKPFDD